MTEHMKPNWAYQDLHGDQLANPKGAAERLVNQQRREKNRDALKESITQTAYADSAKQIEGAQRAQCEADGSEYIAPTKYDLDIAIKDRLFPSVEYRSSGSNRVIPSDEALARRNILSAVANQASRLSSKVGVERQAAKRSGVALTQEEQDQSDIARARLSLRIQAMTTPRNPLVAEGYFFNEQGEMTAEPIWGQPLDPLTQRMQAEAQKFAPKPEETK